MQAVWEQCLGHLKEELPAQQFETWIQPLELENTEDRGLRLLAPNRFVQDWVEDKFLDRIRELCSELANSRDVEIASVSAQLEFMEALDVADHGAKQEIALDPAVLASPRASAVVRTSALSLSSTKPTEQLMQNVAGEPEFYGSKGFVGDDLARNIVAPGVETHFLPPGGEEPPKRQAHNVPQLSSPPEAEGPGLMEALSTTTRRPRRRQPLENNLNEKFKFEAFVEGKSNQLALAASRQVAENPGGSYNPLFIYGGVGLGKTHLMHAVGNQLRLNKPNARVVYLHSERFVADMVKALQLNAINEFKRYYRSVDALLIDDIQFFAKKERSQEEFFHTFNALLEGGRQMILTCDRYPKEIDGLEERLKSRFGWGLTVAVEPPELETRVAILIKKALEVNVELPYESAFFMAQRIQANVRELEGALKRVIASAHFTGRVIDVPFVRETLKDLLALQDKLVTIENIQRTVAEHYKIKLSDMLSKRRNRSVARPRQVGMFLAKQLTTRSLPEIGEAFGGRDHTTVIHACRTIKGLEESTNELREDIKILTRLLKM